MLLNQYLFDNKLKREDFAKRCGVTVRTVQNAIKQEYIIVDNTIYSPRFKIKESLKSGEKEND